MSDLIENTECTLFIPNSNDAVNIIDTRKCKVVGTEISITLYKIVETLNRLDTLVDYPTKQ